MQLAEEVQMHLKRKNQTQKSRAMAHPAHDPPHTLAASFIIF